MVVVRRHRSHRCRHISVTTFSGRLSRHPSTERCLILNDFYAHSITAEGLEKITQIVISGGEKEKEIESNCL